MVPAGMPRCLKVPMLALPMSLPRSAAIDSITMGCSHVINNVVTAQWWGGDKWL